MTSSIDVVISPAADRDIRQILIYTDETWGTGYRDAYRQVLFEAFGRIAEYPEIGRPAQHGPRGSRELVLRHHMILYRPQRTAINILRVVSHRQRRR